jgi:ribosomal protein S18
VSWGFAISGAINALTQIELEKKRERFQENVAEQNRILQTDLSEKSMKHQIELAQKARLAQAEEAEKSRIHSKEMAILNAISQRELSKASMDDVEWLRNYPLTVRKYSFLSTLEQVPFLPVKIVLAPPTLSDTGGRFNDCENFLNASISKFFQSSDMPANYYHFLSGAWKSDVFRGEAAYQNIYKEFGDEPFLIIDCDISRGKYFSFNVCFWSKELQECLGGRCKSVLLLENLDLSEILKSSARLRAKTICEKYLTAEEKIIGELFPQEIKNIHIYHREQEALKSLGIETIDETAYNLSQDDYDECLRVISKISALVSGVVVDMYQLTAGVSNESYMLKRVVDEMRSLPETKSMPLRSYVSQWIIKDYYQLIISQKINKSTMVSIMNQVAESKLKLSELSFLDYNDERLLSNDHCKGFKTKAAIEEAWYVWCDAMGITQHDIIDILNSKDKRQAFSAALERDVFMLNELKRLYLLNPILSARNQQLRKVFELVEKLII